MNQLSTCLLEEEAMKINLRYVFIAAIIFRLILAPLANHPDVGNHIDWGIKFWEYGASKFYAPESNVWAFTWPNQPPGTILIFAIIRKVYELIFGIFWGINVAVPAFPSGVVTAIDKHLYLILLKLPAILADLGIAHLIHQFLAKGKYSKVAKFGAILFLVNPVIWYNSSVWGQTDSVINFFVILSLWLLFRNKPVLATLSFAVSLYIKVSLVIFIPIFLILFIKKFSVKQAIVSLVPPLAVFALPTLLFSFPHEPFSWLLEIYKVKVLTNQLQVITANAFNFWGIFEGLAQRPHSLSLGPVSYQTWGLAAFLLGYIPLLYWLWKNPKAKTAIWVLALASFGSFMFLTNMHERYLYPLFPYLTILTAMSPRLLPLYAGISGVSLINLYNLWFVPRFEFIVILLSAGKGVAVKLLSAVNTALFLIIYQNFLKARQKRIIS